MSNIKVIANYLPQFHSIPENDKWWGEGYTDWNAVKKSKPLYSGHCQPNKPLDDNYYDLSDADNIRWQVELARKYGVYGFGIYHYWFNSNLKLLEKPAEILLTNKDIDIHFCFLWDNATWKRTWSNVKYANDWGVSNTNNDSSNQSNGILAELIYGDEVDWEKHFDYLLPFFKDDRYIKIDGKPVFGIFNQENGTENLIKLIKCWNRLAIENGFTGMYILGKKNHHSVNVTNHLYDYEPIRHGWLHDSFFGKVYQKLRTSFHKRMNYVDKYSYDKIWNGIIRSAKEDGDVDLFYGAFVSYDDTPRRGRKGKIVCGASPEKFKKYMSKLVEISAAQNKEYIFLTAWNEWGEGAYMEPDEKNGYAYLDALKSAIDENERR